MSVESPEFRPTADEPAVQHPHLRTFVAAARAMPAPQVGLDAETLHAAWARSRARRRRVVGSGLAAAASIALVVGLVWPSRHPSPSRGGASVDSSPIARAPASPSAPTAAVAPAPEPSESSPPPNPPRLAEQIEIAALGEATPGEGALRPEILGPHRLRLPPGRWSIDTRTSSVVEVLVPGQTLQLRGGLVHVEVAGDEAHVEVLRPDVVRLDGEGRRVVPEAAVAPGEPRRAPASAEALAHEAENHMAAGRRGQAIKSLRRLITQYPRSTAAQAGLIDLGRLLERAGRVDRARCAYALFLERWPVHSLRADIAAAHRALGEGPGCRGLRPRR